MVKRGPSVHFGVFKNGRLFADEVVTADRVTALLAGMYDETASTTGAGVAAGLDMVMYLVPKDRLLTLEAAMALVPKRGVYVGFFYPVVEGAEQAPEAAPVDDRPMATVTSIVDEVLADEPDTTEAPEDAPEEIPEGDDEPPVEDLTYEPTDDDGPPVEHEPITDEDLEAFVAGQEAPTAS